MKTLDSYYAGKVQKWKNIQNSSISRFGSIAFLAKYKIAKFTKLHEKANAACERGRIASEVAQREEAFKTIAQNGNLISLLSEPEKLVAFLEVSSNQLTAKYSCELEEREKILGEIRGIIDGITGRDVLGQFNFEYGSHVMRAENFVHSETKEREGAFKYWLAAYYSHNGAFDKIIDANERFLLIKAAYSEVAGRTWDSYLNYAKKQDYIREHHMQYAKCQTELRKMEKEREALVGDELEAALESLAKDSIKKQKPSI